MADLTSKLAGSIQKSMSDFGAGIKGAFMSANPAGFGLAMKGIQSVMSNQVSMQKKDFAQRQQDRQFAEENANEQRKIDSDMLGTLHSIDDTLKKILSGIKFVTDDGEKAFRVKAKEEKAASKGKASLPEIIAGVSLASVYKAAKQWEDFFSGLIDAVKGLINGLKSIFSEGGALANLIKRIRDLFAEEGALGNLFKKIKDLFKEEGALGNLFKKFKDLFAEEGALGNLFKKFKDLFSEEGALGNIFKKFKDLFAEEGIFGGIIKKFKDLFSEESALGKGIQELKALFAEEGFFGKIIKGFSELFTEAGFFGKAIQKFKDLFSAESTLGKLFTKIGTIADDVGQFVKGIKPFLEELPILGTFFKGTFRVFETVLSKIPGLNAIFFAIDGLFAAFDTEQIQKTLGVAEVTFKERVAAFIGGGVGGLIGGLIDAGLWLVDKVFGTSFGAKSIKEGGEGNFQERITEIYTKFWNGFFTFIGTSFDVIVNLIKGIFTGNFDEFLKSFDDLTLIFQDWGIIVLNAFGALGVGIYNMFGRFSNWVQNKLKSSETIATIYDSVSGAITTIQNAVGRLFYYLGGVVEDAIYSSKKYIADMSEKYLGIKINVDKPATRAAYVEYKAQKFSENYKQTEYVPITYTPIKNVAGEKRAAVQAEKNATYDANTSETQRLANRSKPAVGTDTSAGPLSNTGSGDYTPSPVSPDYSGQLSNLTPQQTAIAEKIYSKFIAAGFSDVQAQAAVANAYAESRLNPNASNISSKEASFGLFQLNSKGGVGSGYSAEYLKDVDNNIALIIKEAKGKAGEQFRASNTLSGATSTFAQYVERPYSPAQVGENRAAMATNSASVLAQLSRASLSGGGGNYSNYSNEGRGSNSNVNSPTDTPTGTKDDPLIVAQGAADPVEKAIQDEVTKANIQTPVLSQAQLDEMKAQQLYREKMDAENKKYRDERDSLEKQFRQTLENNIRGQLGSAIPMGATSAGNVGGNLASKYLSKPMEDLATKIFGKETGAGIGSIFTQLAGSYGNQLIGGVLAPMLGMSGDQMNRSLNNFAAGNEGMGWSDLLYGMTGVSTDLRTAFGYETGLDSLSKNIAGITASPFSPLFKMGSSASGVSAGEVSATNAGQITQNAAIQQAQIQVAGSAEAAKQFVYGVGEAGRNFSKSITSGGGGGQGAGGGGIVGAIVGAITGDGGASGGSMTAGWGSRDAGGDMSGGGSSTFMGRLGNMLTGGKGGEAAGVSFATNLAGSFLGNKLGLNKNTLGGVYAQTGINAAISSMLTTGGPGVLATLGKMSPGALAQRGISSLAGMLPAGTIATGLGEFGIGLSTQGMTGAQNVAMYNSSGSTMGQLGSVAGAIGNAYGAVQLSNALSGGYKMDSNMKDVVDAAVAIGSYFDITGGFLAAGAGALFNRAFGHGAPELTAMGIQGTLGTTKGGGTTIGGYQNIHEAGGWFSSDRNTESSFALGDNKMNQMLQKSIDNQLIDLTSASDILGISSDNYANFKKSFKIDMMGLSLADQQQVLSSTLESFNNDMLTSVFPFFERFTEAGEKPVDALNRLAKSTQAFDAGYQMLGFSPYTLKNSYTTGLDAGANPAMYGIMTDSSGNRISGTSLITASDPTSMINLSAVRNAAFASGTLNKADYYGKTYTTVQPEGYSIGGNGFFGFGKQWYVPPAYTVESTDYSNYVGNSYLDSNLLAASKNKFLEKFDPSGKGDLVAGMAGYQAATTSLYKNFMTPEQQRAAVSTAANTALAKVSSDTGVSINMLSKVLTKEATYGTYGTDWERYLESVGFIGPKTLTPAEYAPITATTTKEQIAKIKSNYFDRVTDAEARARTQGLDSAAGIEFANLKKNADSFNTSIDALYSVAIGAASANNPAIDIKKLNTDLAANIANAKVLEATGNAARGAVVGASVLAGGALAAGSMTARGYTLSPTLTTVLGGNANNFITPITVNPITVGTPTGTIGAERRDTSGQLVVPTTNYVDNSSVTNINGGGGYGGGVRDMYSHPILGSTERSISSTYNYNYLYR